MRHRVAARMRIPRECWEFLRVLQRRYKTNLVSMVLFGSAVKGRMRPDSDIDLLVVAGHLPKSRLDRHRPMRQAARRVSKTFAQKVSVIPLTPQEAATTKPFYLGMLGAHARLFDRGDFFEGVLTRLQRRLKTLGAKRYEEPDGDEYWILKPDAKPGERIVL